MVRSPEISKDDLAVLKGAIFTDDIITQPIIDYSSILVTIRGTPNISVANTYQRAVDRLALVPGLSNRLRIFVLPEYRQQENEKSLLMEKYSGSKYEPMFLVISADATPRPQGVGEFSFGLVTFILTLATCFTFASDVNSLNEGFIQKAQEVIAGSQGMLVVRYACNFNLID